MSQNALENGTVACIEQRTNGIAIEKTVELEDSVAKTRFEIDSRRDEPAEVELVEALPDELSGAEVGFHADFHPEHWTTREDDLVFETTVAPTSEVVTMYAIKLSSRAAVEQLRVQPAVEVSPDAADEIAAAVERVMPDDEDGGRPVAGSSDSESPAETGAMEFPAASDGTGESPDPRSASEDAVASLIEELEGDDAEKRRAALREALGLDVPNTFESRLRHVQRRVDDLVAHREALEAFIDENGTAQQIVVELQKDQEELGAALDALEGSISELDDRVDDCASEGRADEIASSVDDLRGELDALREEHEAAVARTDRRLDELEANLRDEVAELRAEVEAGKEWRESVEEVFVRQ